MAAQARLLPGPSRSSPPPPRGLSGPLLVLHVSFQMAPRPFPSIPPPSRAAHHTGRGALSDSVLLYQVPVYATEESVRLDVGKSSLRPAAEPLLRVLGVRVQMRTSQHRARQPLISPVPSRGTGLPSPGLKRPLADHALPAQHPGEGQTFPSLETLPPNRLSSSGKFLFGITSRRYILSSVNKHP